MRPQFEGVIEQFKTAIEIWRAEFSKLPTSFQTAQGLTVETKDLGVLLEQLFAAVQAIGSSDAVNAVIFSIHHPGITNGVAQISSAIGQLPNNPSVALLDHVAQHCWGIQAGVVWLLPPFDATRSHPDQISDAELSAQRKTIKSMTSESSTGLGKIAKLKQENEKVLAESNEILEKLKAFEREGSTAKTTTEASAASAVANKELIEKLVNSLQDALKRQEGLQSQIDSLSDKAVQTLESTSKVALAAAFSARAKALRFAQFSWAIAFITGIVVLGMIGIGLDILPIKLPPLIGTDGRMDLLAIFPRLFAVGPVVWFTWFSVRQYGQTARLIEDYAFKEASALAFVGYQREMSNDPEMIRLLRESAIKNFGSSPTKIFTGIEHASPMHELMDKALEKGIADKLFDFLGALRSKK